MADAEIRKALAGFSPLVRVGADTRDAQVAITGLQSRMTALSGKLADLRIGADTKQAEAAIVRMQAKLLALAKQTAAITMQADTSKLDAQIAAEQAKLAGLRQAVSDLKINADATGAAAKIAGLQQQVAHLYGSLDKLTADVDINAALTKIYALEAQLKLLQDNAEAVRVAADITAANASISAVQARIATLKQQASDIRMSIDTQGLLTAEAQLLGLEHAAEGLTDAVPKADKALGVFGGTVTGLGRGWGILLGNVSLFGGLLNRVLPAIATSVTVWHIVADAIVELGAVLIPASLAFTAFGIAGSDAAKEISNRMQVVHTVMDATGQSIYPMTNAMEQLHNAVRPEVYQLFGDAITIMNAKTGLFAQVAKGTATVVDQLAARFTYAVTQGGGLNVFMRNAVTDAAQLGTVIGNIGGIFGNLSKTVPGFAQVLLGLAVSFTAVLENITRVLEPAIHWTLLLHGFILYTGLAVTSTLAFIGAMGNLARLFVTFAAGQVLSGVTALKTFGTTIAGLVTRLYAYGSALVAIAAEEGVFAAATLAIQDIPIIVWITAAAAAIAGLFYLFRSGPSVTQQFTEGLQKTISAAQLASVITTIQSAQTSVTQKLAQAQKELASTTEYQNVTNARTGVTTRLVTQAYSDQQNAVNALKSAQQQLSSQYQLVSGRIGDLAKQYGGNTQALGALNAAGITTSQILDTNNQHWAEALIQVNATTQAYKAMGTQSGALGNDLDVLGRTVTDQYSAIQKLNQGWNTFISDVTSTQGSLDTVIQGFETLDTHSGDLKLTLGKLKTSFADNTTALKDQGAVASATAAVASAQNTLNKLEASGHATALQLSAAHDRLAAAQDRVTVAQNNMAAAQRQGTAAIDALTPAGVALNQAFTDQVQNLSKLYESWRTAGLANNLFVTGVKDSIAPLVKYAGGSQEATAQLIALAEQAGYQGPVSLQNLVKWLGNTHDATQKVKDITDQATVQEALLTGAMQAQGNYIANQLIGDINNAILKYNGVAKAATDYGNAVAKSGAQSDAAQAARQRLITDLINSGKAAGDSENQIAAMISKVLSIPPKEAIQIVMQGDGSYQIQQQLAVARIFQSRGQGNGPQGVIGSSTGGGIPGGAAGMMIPSSGANDRDSVLVAAKPGELLVPTHLVNAVKPVLGGKIPGFAGGGVIPGFAGGGTVPNFIQTGNTAVLSGQYAIDMVGQFRTAMTNAMLQAMKQSLNRAIQAAQVPNVGSGVARWAPLVAEALAMEGLAASLLPQVLYQMQTESGGNPNAINLTDVNAQRGDPSRGLLQTIGATFAAYHWPGTSWNIYDPLANIAAALNYAAHIYGPSLMRGGAGIGSGHGYGYGGVINEHVLGIGMQTGAAYSIGERGPETVTPGVPGLSGGGGMTAGEAAIAARLDRLITLMAGAPAAYANSLSGVASRAASRGYYGSG